MAGSRTIRIDKTKLLFYIVAIDALFLPYIRILHASLSMIILAVWYVAKIRNINCDKQFNAVICFIFIGIFSIICGGILSPDNVKITFINFITLLFCMLYYYFFLFYLRRKNINLEKIFFSFMIFSSVMALIYRVKPQFYFILRSYWSMSGTTITFESAFWNRYTFIVSDPNSIGPILCSMMLFILAVIPDENRFKKIFSILLTGITVLVTISTTAVLIYLGSIFLYVITKKWYKWNRKISKFGMIVLFSVVLLGLIGGGRYIQDTNLFQVNTLELLWVRVGNNIKDGTLSGRTEIWKHIIDSFNWLEYMIIGRGAPVDSYGTIIRPHNGYFYMILSYGAIGCISFLYIFFRKPNRSLWKQYIPLIPMLLLFSVNTLVLDYRAMLALSLLSAFYHACGEKKVIVTYN